MANEQNNQAQVTQEKYMNAPLWRVFLADLLTKVENWFITKYNAALQVLTNSAWAANNSVNVGMTETAEVLNPMLARPSTEQIYTTQPQWDFDEGESLQLGSTWTDTSVTPNKVYPIPSIIHDKGYDAAYAAWEEAAAADKPAAWAVVLQHQHVVFPVWQWDTTEEKYGFKPMPITYRHNLNVYGGGLDGFLWLEVEGSAYTPGEGDTHLTFRTENAVKVGTWCKFTDENSKVYYGYVSAVIPDGDYESVTIMGVGFESDGSEITKVELYKPIGQ